MRPRAPPPLRRQPVAGLGAAFCAVVVARRRHATHCDCLHVNGAGVTCVCWADDRLYTGGEDKAVKVWEVGSGACTHTIIPAAAGAGAGGGGSSFAAALMGGHAATDTATGSAAVTMTGHASPLVALECMSYMGIKLLVTASLDGTIKVRARERASEDR